MAIAFTLSRAGRPAALRQSCLIFLAAGKAVSIELQIPFAPEKARIRFAWPGLLDGPLK